MNFLSQLAKGFVRSTVNQVGRDTGRVISNQIYGNAHSTPIKGVTCTDGIFYDESNNTQISENEFSSRLRMEGLKIQYFVTHPLIKTFIFLMGIFATAMIKELSNIYYALIPSVLLVVIGICKAMVARHQMTVYYTKPTPTYTKDRRYSTGRRYTGHTLATVETTTIPTKSFIIKSWITCVIYILYAIMLYAVSTHITNLENGDMLEMWSLTGKCLLIVFTSLVVMNFLFRRIP